MTESELQKNVIQLAELRGFLVYHVANVRGQLRSHTSKGFPDLVMEKGERLIFSELKSESGKLSENQKTWRNALEDKENWEYYLWRPGDWNVGWIEAILDAR